jgi:hypothetical protein
MPKRVPSYRLHKPSGQAVVTLCSRDFYLGPWQSRASKQEYDRLTGEWMANGRRLPAPDEPAELTMVELLAAYLAHAKTYYVKNGVPTGQLALIKQTQRLLRETHARQGLRAAGPPGPSAADDRARPPAASHRGAETNGDGQAKSDDAPKSLCRRTINDHCDRIKRMFRGPSPKS